MIRVLFIFLFFLNSTFASGKDFKSDRWGKMVYDKVTKSETLSLGTKKVRVKLIAEDYFEMKNYCNILTSRKYIEKKTKKNFGEDFTVNNCTACKTKEEKLGGFTMCPYPELMVTHIYEDVFEELKNFAPDVFSKIPFQPSNNGRVASFLKISMGQNEDYFILRTDNKEYYEAGVSTYKTPMKLQEIKTKSTGIIQDTQIKSLVDNIIDRMENVIDLKFEVLLSSDEIDILKRAKFTPEINIQRRD